MKILLVSDNLLVPSAYAIQAHLLAKELIKAGHTVIVFGSTFDGRKIEVDGVSMIGNPSPAFPMNSHGDDMMGLHAGRLGCDLIITLKDPRIYDPSYLRSLPVPWIAITPIDTEPVNTETLIRLNYASHVIAVTEHGQAALAREGINASYAPLMIDMNFWTPGDKVEARRRLGWPEEKFIGLIIGNNNDHADRKNFTRMLLAWDASKREDWYLFLHTDMAGAVNLLPLIEGRNWKTTEYSFSDPYLYAMYGFTRQYIRDLYRAADVLFAASAGEGMHMPSLEAQSCGLPVLGCNFAAQRDTILTGWKIPSEHGGAYGEWEWTSLGGFRFRPSQQALRKHLEAACEARNNAEMAEAARAGMVKFSVPYAIDNHWLPGMERLESLFIDANLLVSDEERGIMKAKELAAAG